MTPLDGATWIEPDEPVVAPPGERPVYRLQHAFTLDEVSAAAAWVTAHGVYELFVNGHRVGDLELTPGFTAYRSRLQVQVQDLTGLVRAGRNHVEILLSDGWFRGRHGFERHADGYGDRVAALLALETGGATVTTGSGWWSRPSGTVADLMDGQLTDLREPAPGTPRVDGDPAWRPARAVRGGLYDDRERLVTTVGPPVRRIEELPPAGRRRISPTCTVVDFGQNINGWVRLGDLGPAGTTTTLTHGEMLDADGRVTTENLRAFDFRSGERLPAGQVDSVIAAGRPGEVFEPRHTTHGFRYVQIDGAAASGTASATAVVVHTDLARTGTFRCSDERVDALHRAAVWSFRGNACDVPTDCPQRERSGFTGDWQVYVDAAAFTHDVAGFSDKWLRDLAAEQRPDGRVPSIVPEPQDPAGDAATLAMEGSAGWGDAAVFVPWALWRAYGDRAVLERQYPSMTRWVDYAAGVARSRRHPDRTGPPAPHEKYLWDTGFHFGEWLEPGEVPSLDPDRDHGIVATAYLARSARLLSRIAALIGRAEDHDRYGRLALDARDGWQREYLDGALRSQADHVRALAFDLVPDDRRAEVAAGLVKLLAATGHHLGTGFLSTGMMLQVLSDTGHHDVACRVLMSTGVPSWLGMIDLGATTVWENWAGADDPRGPGSLNHYAKGAVISFLHTHVAGLRMLDDPGPDEAGYRRFVVEPRPGAGLEWAEAEHDGPQGRIRSAWRWRGNGLLLEVDVPPGSTAEVRLPDGRVTEAGPGRHTFDGA